MEGVTNLQYGELMHFPRASGDHALQQRKLVVHLGPPPPFNEAVRRLAGDLAARCTRGGRLLLLISTGVCGGRRRSCFRCARGPGVNLLLGTRLHLYDLASAHGRRGQGELVFGRLDGGWAPAGLDCLAWLEVGGLGMRCLVCGGALLAGVVGRQGGLW